MLSLATMGAGRYNFSCFNRMLLRLFTIAVIMLSLPLGFSAGSEAQEISGYKVALRNLVFSHPTPLSVQEQKELARKSTRLNSSHVAISYAVFCLKKKNSYEETHD